MWAAMFGCLRGRIALLHGCLPPEGYLVVVFPSTVDELVSRAHIWLIMLLGVTNKDNIKVERMMFISVCMGITFTKRIVELINKRRDERNLGGG
jgi:hypothetical protein